MMHHSQTEPCITDVDTANKARLECAVPNIGDGECAAVPSRSRAEHARSAANIYDFTDDFDMRRVCSYFERALCNRTVAESDGAALSDIDLQSFVLAYRELNKFVLVFFFHGRCECSAACLLQDVSVVWISIQICSNGRRRKGENFATIFRFGMRDSGRYVAPHKCSR
jgi:hypothetical protein